MTADDLAALLDQYRVGLEAELVLLRRLQEVASRQHAATTEREDIEALQRAADERDRLMAGLVAIDQRIGDARERLARARDQVRRLPGVEEVVSLHKTVCEIISAILDTDRDSIRALEQVVAARRLAAQTLEQAESTLAAYGRVAIPPPAATLVNRRG